MSTFRNRRALDVALNVRDRVNNALVIKMIPN